MRCLLRAAPVPVIVTVRTVVLQQLGLPYNSAGYPNEYRFFQHRLFSAAINHTLSDEGVGCTASPHTIDCQQTSHDAL